jgi:hypothetical protein
MLKRHLAVYNIRMQLLLVGKLSFKFGTKQNLVEFYTFKYIMYYVHIAVIFAYYYSTGLVADGQWTKPKT